MAARFEIFKGEKSGWYYFRLIAKNRQRLLSSEAYKQKSGAKNGIEAVRKNSQKFEQYRFFEQSNGKHYFLLVAGNNQPIAKSQMYASKGGAHHGMHRVMSLVRTAEVFDLTKSAPLKAKVQPKQNPYSNVEWVQTKTWVE